jgi:glycine cleavage system H lipoate-binding protein
MALFDKKDMRQSDQSSCLWMQAGVVRNKQCSLSYQCAACQYDRAMKHAVDDNKRRRSQGVPLTGKRGRLVYWKDKLKERPPWKQPCIHHMKGQIQFRACTHAYLCSDCEFDQYFQDQFAVHAVMRPVDMLSVKGIDIPQGYYLHPGHVWLKIEEEGSVRIGLDDFARRVLGPMDTVEAPLMGKPVKQHQPTIRTVRGENEATFASPVDGVVLDINPKLREKGKSAHEDPYASGWILRVFPDNLRHDLNDLMIGSESQSFLDKEVEKLYQVVEETVGPLAADGGYLGDDIYGNLPQIGWERLTNQFFKSGPH